MALGQQGGKSAVKISELVDFNLKPYTQVHCSSVGGGTCDRDAANRGQQGG